MNKDCGGTLAKAIGSIAGSNVDKMLDDAYKGNDHVLRSTLQDLAENNSKGLAQAVVSSLVHMVQSMGATQAPSSTLSPTIARTVNTPTNVAIPAPVENLAKEIESLAANNPAALLVFLGSRVECKAEDFERIIAFVFLYKTR